MLENSQLGKQSNYIDQYDASILFPIPRQIKRDELNISQDYKFNGVDIWTAFEVSWLNLKGKPLVRLFKFTIDSNSTNIIESKSFKLYLNSFNNTKFASENDVIKQMKIDLEKSADGKILLESCRVDNFSSDYQIQQLVSTDLDEMDIDVDDYVVNDDYLKAESNEIVTETLTTNLLKSNCLVTGQPDWGSVIIQYKGEKINREGLLKYIISFRNHNEFHEQCVERIYIDIMKKIKPEKLLVYARYTRRGGLDINPLRANFDYDVSLTKMRLVRQ